MYLFTCVLTYLHTYLCTYILIYLHIYLFSCLLTYILAYLLTYLFTYILMYLHTYLVLTYVLITYLHTYLCTYLLIYILTYLLTYSLLGCTALWDPWPAQLWTPIVTEAWQMAENFNGPLNLHAWEILLSGRHIKRELYVLILWESFSIPVFWLHWWQVSNFVNVWQLSGEVWK